MTFGRDYDQWLEEPYQRSCDADSAFEIVKQRILESDWNPHTFDSFTEALFDADFSVHQDALSKAIAEGESGFEQIGKVIWQIVYHYCEYQATKQARLITESRT